MRRAGAMSALAVIVTDIRIGSSALLGSDFLFWASVVFLSAVAATAVQAAIVVLCGLLMRVDEGWRPLTRRRK
jgi:hypothetical protein